MKDVYSQVQEMKSLLERLAENLPTTAQKLEEHEQETRLMLQDHETRIRKVEMRIWQIMAIAGFIAAGMPIIISLLD